MTNPYQRRAARRLRAPLVFTSAAAMLLASVGGTAAAPAAHDDVPPHVSTDPSAEDAAGRLDTAEEADARAERRDRSTLRSAPTLAEPDTIVVEDGVSQPVFSYEEAVRETVVVPGVVSSENGDEIDQIMVDIIRPAASDGDLDVPTIIVPSPYFDSPGRGRAGERKPTPTADGGIDFFPLYYDNYFVPRGYAVALLDLAGTRGSTGCLDIGGPAEIDNTVRFVEWLNNAEGSLAYDVEGNEVTADWSNGLSAMVGKSWDGTVANGVAATGVEGLATIVPITAISSWHKYYWDNGVGYAGSPLNLANNIRDVPAARCTETNAELAVGGADPDPTTDFWTTRNYELDASNVQASVFVVHGTNDYNVKPHNYGPWFELLAEHDVPRKIWLSEVAHEKGFDFRRDEWLTTINRWFDHWLQGVDNGIMDEPMADVEHGPDQWSTYDTWPGGTSTTLQLGVPRSPADARPAAMGIGRGAFTNGGVTFRETRQSPANASNDGLTARDDRAVFLTDELRRPLRVSGSTTVSVKVTPESTSGILSAYLVDYGTATRTNHASSGGILDLASVSCFGQGTATDTGCYRDVERRTTTQPFHVIARGWADLRFLTGEDELTPGETYRVAWDIFPDDYVFEAGHRIGIVISGSDTATRDPYPAAGRGNVTLDLAGSHVKLPIEGGTRALLDATGARGGR